MFYLFNVIYMKRTFCMGLVAFLPWLIIAQTAVCQPIPVPQRATTEEGHIWWYHPGDYTNGLGLTLSFQNLPDHVPELASYADQHHYNLCMTVPSKFAGCVIKKVKIALAPPSAKYSTDYIKVWLSPSRLEVVDGVERYIIPESADGAESVTKYATARMNGTYFQFYEITLKQPYTVPAEGCFVGYEFETSADTDAFFLWGETDAGGCFMQFDEPDGTRVWRDMSPYDLGNVSTAVYMELSDMVITDATVTAQDERNYRVGDEFYYAWTVTNRGSVAFSTMDIAISVDGKSDPVETVDLGGELPVDGSCTITRKMSFTAPGDHKLGLQVFSADGRENKSPHPVDEGHIIMLNPADIYPSVPVVEEFTSTSCSWCPRGMVGLARLKEIYGDNIITLAGHTRMNYADPMYCADYADVLGSYNVGLPSAVFNRVAIADPYLGEGGADANGGRHFAADRFVERIRTEYPGEGKVRLVAEWADAERTAIQVKAISTFSVDREESPYRLAFILSEDDMQDNGEGFWWQLNSYSSEQGDMSASYPDEDMKPWLEAPSKVATDFDHVVVAAWEALHGIEGSVPAPIVKGRDIAYSGTLSIAGNALIQDKDKLTLNVLLLNNNNGYVINGAHCPILPQGETAITDVSAEGVAVTGIYRMDGRAADAVKPGVNIVRYSDGSVKKILVK